MMLQQKDNMTTFSKVLEKKIIKEHQEIANLTVELNELKFLRETKEEPEQQKLEKIEIKRNEAEDKMKK